MTFETDQADPPRQRISRRKVFERRREQECKRPTPLVPDWLYDTHQVALFTGRSVSSIDKDASCGTGLPGYGSENSGGIAAATSWPRSNPAGFTRRAGRLMPSRSPPS